MWNIIFKKNCFDFEPDWNNVWPQIKRVLFKLNFRKHSVNQLMDFRLNKYSYTISIANIFHRTSLFHSISLKLPKFLFQNIYYILLFVLIYIFSKNKIKWSNIFKICSPDNFVCSILFCSFEINSITFLRCF